MKLAKHLLRFAAMMMAITGCGEKLPGVQEGVLVEIGAESLNLEAKSSYLATEADADRVNNFSVFIFDGTSALVNKQYSSNGSAVQVALVSGSTYSVRVLANMGDLTSSISSLTELNSYKHPVSSSSIQNNGLPMYGSQSVTVSATSVTIPVTRLVARYEFRLDKSAVTGGTLTLESLTIRNIANMVNPTQSFKASSGQIAATGDYTSPSDISAINAGSGIYLYVPENMQGVESGLTDSSEKQPRGEAGAYGYSTVNTDYCTYIEAGCVYNNGTNRSVTYRVMLGENSTSSFNIARNTKYVVTLRPTGNPLSSSWWKCEPESTKTLVGVSVSPTTWQINVGETAYFTATAHYDDGTSAVVTTSPGTTWSVISEGSAAQPGSSKGDFVGTGSGTATVQVSFGGMTETATLTVLNPVTTTYELNVTPSTATITVGGGVSLSAYLVTKDNGVVVRQENVTSYCSWMSSDSSIASTDYSGNVSGVSAGTAYVIATYNALSVTGSAIINVSGGSTPTPGDVIKYELEVTPGNSTVQKGNTQQFTATYYTVTNGVRNAGTDVTSSASWSSSSTSVATVSGGLATGNNVGAATITATYSEKSGSATLTVTEAPVVTTHELEVTPGNNTCTVGGTASFTATYWTLQNGVRTTSQNVTSSASWSSQNTDVATSQGGGTFRGEHVGSTLVTATYNGESDSATLDVTAAPTHELVVSPSSQTITTLNGTAQFTATYYTVTNGVRDAGVNVTASANWSSSNPGVATVSGGTAVGLSDGTATITATYGGCTATYGGCTATGTVTVNLPVTYTVAISSTSVTIENQQMIGNASNYIDFGCAYFTVTMKNNKTGAVTDVTSQCVFNDSGHLCFTGNKLTCDITPQGYLGTPPYGGYLTTTLWGNVSVDFDDPSGEHWRFNIDVEIILTIDNDTDA